MILTRREVRALNQIGDLMAPGWGPLPRFSTTGCVQFADELFRSMPAQDVADVRLLLRLLSYLPRPALAAVLALLQTHRFLPRGLGTPLRMIEFAFRGIVMTLYYSGKIAAPYAGPVPIDVIGFTVHVTPGTAREQPS